MSHPRKRGSQVYDDSAQGEMKGPRAPCPAALRVELSEDAFDIDPDELEAHLLAMDEQMAAGAAGPLVPLTGSLPLAPLPPSPTHAANALGAPRGAGSSSGSIGPGPDDRDFLADPDLAREFDEPFELRSGAHSSNSVNTHVCQDCGSISYNVVFQKVFGLLVCNTCRRAGSGRDEAGQQTGKYALCTKGVAKDHYLLSDGELADLAFISKPNPRKQSWGDMKLFLRSQVEAKSFEKHGGAAGLAAAKHKREVTRIERRLAANKRQRRKEAPPRPYIPPPEHVHTFERVGAPSESSTEVTERCTGCKLERTFEEF